MGRGGTEKREMSGTQEWEDNGGGWRDRGERDGDGGRVHWLVLVK